MSMSISFDFDLIKGDSPSAGADSQGALYLRTFIKIILPAGQ